MTNYDKLKPVQLPEPKLRKVADLRPALRNARTHSRKQVRQIADSIRAFGFTNPVLVDATGEVIAGHGRLAAAQLLGLAHVLTLCLDWLSGAEQRAYVIADNRPAEPAGCLSYRRAAKHGRNMGTAQRPAKHAASGAHARFSISGTGTPE